MTKLPPLIELRAFEAAARHLSFKQAAAELGVTPTAVSHQIRLLERYCGCALFRRRPRPLILTEAGARLFPVIRDGLEAFSTALASVKHDADKELLRVTTTNAFASRWLVPRLPCWRQLDAHAPLEVIGTDAVLDLQAGEADVAIRYARSWPTDGHAQMFLQDTFWPVCSAQLLASGRLNETVLLRGQVLVHCYWSPSDLEAPTWRRWLALAASTGRELPELRDTAHLSFREELHAIEAVLAGQGIGIFSDLLIADELAAGTLVKISDLSLPGYCFFVVRPPAHPRSKMIDAFVDWLQLVS